MILRSLLFSSDRATGESIGPALAELGVEAEYCDDATAAIERVSSEPFQIVILDWDDQPGAAQVLKTARERKASERPLTLAIVGSDPSVPQALRAGVNSILRRPLLASQVKDTLTTARDLLRAKQGSVPTLAAAAAVGAGPASTPSPLPTHFEAGSEKRLRAGEFLQSSSGSPGSQFETDSNSESALGSAEEPVDPVSDLESVAAASATQQVSPPVPPPDSDQPRGLEWYMKARAGAPPRIPAQVAQAIAAAAPAPAPAKAELLGYDQNTSAAETSDAPAKWAPGGVSAASTTKARGGFEPAPALSEGKKDRENKTEAELFAYISGVGGDSEQQEAKPPSRLGRRAVFAALVLAAATIVAAPQAPWHPVVLKSLAHTLQATRSWLNPQVVTKTAPAPAAHEDFGRAGDEYKLPVAENIPDATTDPSQIRIVPMVDPTAKQPNNNGAGNTGQTPAQVVPAGTDNSTQDSSITVKEKGPEAPAPPTQGVGDAGTSAAAPTSVEPAHSEAAVPASTPPTAIAPAGTPTPKTAAQPQYVPAQAHAGIPSSLKSQLASMTPEASGNKAAESAMPSIEPVTLSEAAARALLTDQPALSYPANANGQQGKVVLQVLIGRDGSVEDAKFMQGSLAFARAAIDNVKLWHFKPYLMNGRAVSVQTPITVSFKPGP